MMVTVLIKKSVTNISNMFPISQDATTIKFIVYKLSPTSVTKIDFVIESSEFRLGPYQAASFKLDRC